MSIQLQHITIDCHDALVLSTFWSAALGRAVDPGAETYFASIGREARDTQVAFLFTKVDEGKTAKNRMHTDFHADDREAEVERLVGLGATRVAEKDEWGTRWTVMTDPEGNEFCVA